MLASATVYHLIDIIQINRKNPDWIAEIKFKNSMNDLTDLSSDGDKEGPRHQNEGGNKGREGVEPFRPSDVNR